MTRMSIFRVFPLLLLAAHVLPSAKPIEKHEAIRAQLSGDRYRGRWQEPAGSGRHPTTYRHKEPRTPEDFEAVARAEAKRERRRQRNIRNAAGRA